MFSHVYIHLHNILQVWLIKPRIGSQNREAAIFSILSCQKHQEVKDGNESCPSHNQDHFCTPISLKLMAIKFPPYSHAHMEMADIISRFCFSSKEERSFTISPLWYFSRNIFFDPVGRVFFLVLYNPPILALSVWQKHQHYLMEMLFWIRLSPALLLCNSWNYNGP